MGRLKYLFIGVVVVACLFCSSCGTIFGGRITECQEKIPAPGKPPREVRPAALIGDILFWPALIVDFVDGAMYVPCKLDSAGKAAHVEQQKEESREQYNPITINAGAGVSIMQTAVTGFNLSGEDIPRFLSETPAYNATIDYTFIKHFSVGICAAYQSLTDNPAGEYRAITWETERITRTNVAARLLYHFPRRKHTEYYVGTRIGKSMWTDRVISYSNVYYTPPFTTLSPSYSAVSFQALAGVEIFPIYNVGIHFEAGIGTPYLLEGGITFRFKTKNGETQK